MPDARGPLPHWCPGATQGKARVSSFKLLRPSLGPKTRAGGITDRKGPPRVCQPSLRPVTRRKLRPKEDESTGEEPGRWQRMPSVLSVETGRHTWAGPRRDRSCALDEREAGTGPWGGGTRGQENDETKPGDLGAH